MADYKVHQLTVHLETVSEKYRVLQERREELATQLAFSREQNRVGVLEKEQLVQNCDNSVQNLECQLSSLREKHNEIRGKLTEMCSPSVLQQLERKTHISQEIAVLQFLLDLKSYVKAAEDLVAADKPLSAGEELILLCSAFDDFQEVNAVQPSELVQHARDEIRRLSDAVVKSLTSFALSLSEKFICSLQGLQSGEKLTDFCRLEDRSQFADAIAKLLSIFSHSSAHSSTDSFEDSVVKIALDPLRSRFDYHFCSDRKTNSLDKPEWMLSQILIWLETVPEFIEHTAFSKCSISRERIELIVQRIQTNIIVLAMTKLRSDLPNYVEAEDPIRFTHLVDQLILFDSQVHIQGQSFLSVICDDHSAVTLWLSIERQCATERIEQLLDSDEGWFDRYPTASDIDLYKAPVFVDEFIVLLASLTNRYRGVPSESAVRRRFTSLQVELLEEMRMRLLQHSRNQSHSVWHRRFMQIVNAVTYVVEVLQSWDSEPIFNEPHRDDPEESSYAFAGAVDLFDMMVSELIQSLIEEVLVAVELKPRLIQDYFLAESWRSMRPALPSSVSPSLTSSLALLHDRLTLLRSQISAPALAQCIRVLCTSLTALVTDDCIPRIQLVESAALQLRYDFTQGVIRLLQSFVPADEIDSEQQHNTTRLLVNVDLLLTPLMEQLNVLSLSCGNAALLHDTLSANGGAGDTVMSDFSLNMSPTVVLKLLERRIDLPVI